MIRKEIRSYPFKLIFFLLPFATFLVYADIKCFIRPLYEYLLNRDIISFIIGSFIVLPLHAIFVIGLYELFCKVYANDYGLFIKTPFGEKVISWKEVRSCYWQKVYCTAEKDFSFFYLVIETDNKEIKLGPEWTNRDVLMKYVKDKIRQYQM